MGEQHWRNCVEWTEALIERIRKLWILDGYTATEIGEATGLTRNQVMGKLHRIGLVGKSAQPRLNTKKSLSTKTKNPKPSKKKKQSGVVSSAASEQEAERVTPFLAPPPPILSTIISDWTGVAAEVDTLRHRECHWPIGEPVSGFCRHPVENFRSVYCAYHAHVAHYGEPKPEAA